MRNRCPGVDLAGLFDLDLIGIWRSMEIGYIPNYSHLIGIMIINHWV